MFIFLRLLLAHFLGDFPLQFDLIFRLKHKGLKGILPHALIIFSCFIVLCWPYLHLPQVWFFIFFLGITHLFQDSLKLNYNATKYSFWTYLLDQLFHVGFIALVFLTDLKKIPPPDNTNHFIVQLYSNNIFIAYIIALIIATYNGFFLIRCFNDTFLGKRTPSSFEKWYGMGERAIIVSLFIIDGTFLWLLLVIFLFRPITFALLKKKYNLHINFNSLTEILLSWSVALITGIALSLFQANYLIY